MNIAKVNQYLVVLPVVIKSLDLPRINLKVSYKCQKCGKGQPPRTPAYMLVVETAEINVSLPLKEGESLGEEVRASQIKKELKVCGECKEKYTQTLPVNIIPQSQLRKIERSRRKRLEREEEEAEEMEA